MQQEVRLRCLSAEHAAAVVKEAHRPGALSNTVRQDGDTLVIGYSDKRWPLDVAVWAAENGHCGDESAGTLIGSL